jgi:hypothetical protein
VSMNRITTTSGADDPRHGQDPPSDAAQRDGRPMLRIRSNVVISSILQHVRHLSVRYPTAGMIDEQMLAVVLVPIAWRPDPTSDQYTSQVYTGQSGGYAEA